MDASTSTHDVTLPSGLRVALRPLRLAEENQLAQARRATRRKQEALLNRILAACTEAVLDHGPYSDLGERVDWAAALTGDRIGVMLALHRVSYRDGDYIYVDRIQCPGCHEVYAQRIHIDEDLTVQRLSPEGRERMLAGDHPTVEVAGATVAFALASGATEKKFEQLRENYSGERDATAALRSRIVSVTLADGERVDPQDIAAWLDGTKPAYPGLTSADAEDLRDAMDAADCGYDLDVEALCPECGTLTVIALPFDAIFAPSTPQRQRRRARRRASPPPGPGSSDS